MVTVGSNPTLYLNSCRKSKTNWSSATARAPRLVAAGPMCPNRRRQRGTFIARIRTDAGGAGYFS
ncbi:hypothetical protein, partial [Escherichia coli]|uniref:hypothetical protein n=1 Tax=Escherichia coli TaxID=562 RepID=UPI00228159EB